MKKLIEEDETGYLIGFILISALIALFLVAGVSAVDPAGPTTVNVTSNVTKTASSASMVNISGGKIATLNISATMQNPRWKAFIGWVTGKFTLDDNIGATIYDWTFSLNNGRVYATRNSTSIKWSGITCANVSNLIQENIAMNLTNSYDNITATFNNVNHTGFWAGSTYFSVNQCNYTINTYVNNATQSATSYFEEVALYDGSTSLVYATLLEVGGKTGYNGLSYDFQMLVPENGAPSFVGATAYYLYVEIA
jgi:hypothetical protein